MAEQRYIIKTDDGRIELYLYINYAGVPQDEQYLKDLTNAVDFNK